MANAEKNPAKTPPKDTTKDDSTVDPSKTEGTRGREEQNTAPAYETSDTQVAEEAGITEGEMHALRDDAGLNQLAGHDMDIHAWSESPQGKEWAEGEDDRVKKYEEEEKAYEEQFEKDGLREAEAKYAEVVNADVSGKPQG